jgi:hypothetical protein
VQWLVRRSALDLRDAANRFFAKAHDTGLLQQLMHSADAEAGDFEYLEARRFQDDIVKLLPELRDTFSDAASSQSIDWRLLAAVKTEFGTFGDILARTKKQLESVSNTLDAAEVRTRSIERKLRGVEVLPEAEAAQLLREQPSLVIDVNPSNDESADLDLDPSASTGGS